jgi:hypothetical protein
LFLFDRVEFSADFHASTGDETGSGDHYQNIGNCGKTEFPCPRRTCAAFFEGHGPPAVLSTGILSLKGAFIEFDGFWKS